MTTAPRRWRLNVMQVLLLAALVGLLVGVGSAAWRVDQSQLPVGVCVAPDGNRIATWSEHNTIQVWDVGHYPARRISEDAFGPHWFAVDQPMVFTDSQRLAIHRSEDTATGLSAWVEFKNVEARQQVGRMDLGGTPDVAFATAGNRLVSMSPASGVQMWDLSGRRQSTQFPVPPTCDLVRLSGDGKKLVTEDWQRMTVEVWETANGRLLHASKISAGHYLAARPSAQGKWLAMVGGKASPATASPLQTASWEIVVYEVDSGRVVVKLDVGLGYPSDVVFSPDDTSMLCVLEGEQSRLVELPGGKTKTLLEDSDNLGKSYAFMPDGRRLAGVSDHGLTIWDASSGARVQHILQTRTTLQMLLFGGGFLGWAVAWGLFSRTWWPRVQTAGAGDAIELPPPPQPGKRPPNFRRTLLLLWGMMSAVGVMPALSWSDSWPMRVALGAGLGLGLVALTMLVSVAFVMSREMLSKGFQAQLGRAVQTSGRQGHVRRIGRFTAWFVGPSELEPTLPDEVVRCEQRLNDLLGPFEYTRPGLILEFDDHIQMQRHIGRSFRLAGAYYGWSQKQLVHCPPYAVQNLSNPRRVLRSLLGFHALLQRKGFWLPPWVQAVLNAHVMRDDQDQPLLRAAHRRLHLALNRDDVPALDWMRWNRRQLTRAVLQADEAAAARHTTMAFDLAGSLSEYLLDTAPERRRKFADFVNALAKRGSVEAVLLQHYGCSLEQLAGDWLAWLREQPTDPTGTPPPAWLTRQLADETLPLLRDPQADRASRARAVRSLGVAGYPQTAGVLIQLLDRPDAPVRAELIWSLESISGRPLGDDPAAWRAWWQQVNQPDDLSSQSVDWPIGNDVPPAEPDNSVVSSRAQEVSDEAPILASLADSIPTESLQAEPQSDEPPILISAVESPSIPPSGLRQVWFFMGLGGVTAITLSMALLFQSGLWWMPTTYYGILVGTFSLAQAIGQRPRGSRTIAMMQVTSLLNCDPINTTLGIIELILLRGRAVRTYEQREQS